MRLSLVFSFLLLTRLLSGELYLQPSDKLTATDDYDMLPYPKDSGQHFAYWEMDGVVNSTGRSYTAHVARLSEGLPDTFSYRLPPKGSLQEKHIHCPKMAPLQVAATSARPLPQLSFTTVLMPPTPASSTPSVAAVSAISSLITP